VVLSIRDFSDVTRIVRFNLNLKRMQHCRDKDFSSNLFARISEEATVLGSPLKVSLRKLLARKISLGERLLPNLEESCDRRQTASTTQLPNRHRSWKDDITDAIESILVYRCLFGSSLVSYQDSSP
jgi:hypothetical protein